MLGLLLLLQAGLLQNLHAMQALQLGMQIADNSIDQPQPGKLLDMTKFRFVLEPQLSPCTAQLYFLVLVQSQPEHFQERELIRSTWGGVRGVAGWQVRTLFLVGRPASPRPARTSPPRHSLKSRALGSVSGPGFGRASARASQQFRADSLDSLVRLESERHQDILQGNFLDTPGNVTYKHAMGYKWVGERCHAQPRFLLKTEDNVFVEMYHLFNFVSAVYGPDPGPSLVCDVRPAGTAGRRGAAAASQRTTPEHCSGSAYLITPSLAAQFLQAAGEVPLIPQDDVYMTGLVRSWLGVFPFYLNLRYTYELGRPIKWLFSKKQKPLPFIFVVSESPHTRSWPGLVRALWAKSEQIQHQHYIK